MAHSTTMTTSTVTSVAQRGEVTSRITALGLRVLRYGLALFIAWIGMMKFTGYEAHGIEPLVANSLLLGWMYHIWTVRQFAAGLGVVEISIAILIALRPWSRKASAIGSAAAVLMFLTTLSFLFSTPGWEPSLGGFPALSGAVGQFLIKDVVLLGAATWSLGEALTASNEPAREC
jgi:reactive chlorine resistance protein C